MSTFAIITRTELILRWQRERLRAVKLRRPLIHAVELYRLQGLVACIFVMIWPTEADFERDRLRVQGELRAEVLQPTFLSSLVVFFMMHHVPKTQPWGIHVELIRIQTHVPVTRWNCGETRLLTRKAMRGASFASKDQLRSAIESFVTKTNEYPKPFHWREREVKGSQLRNTIVNLRN